VAAEIGDVNLDRSCSKCNRARSDGSQQSAETLLSSALCPPKV